MTTCQRRWQERYVTHEKHVSIKTLDHACMLPPGHDSEDAKKKRPCVCRCEPAGMGSITLVLPQAVAA